MRIQMRYYSILRDITRTPAEDYDLDDGATIGDSVTRAIARHPLLANHRGAMLIARNSQYCAQGELLKDGDVVDLMPPVSGG